MKYLMIALCLISTSLIAQKREPRYFSIRGGAAFTEDNPKAMGNISFGFSPNKTTGIGIGAGFVALDKTYIPLTVDLSYFGKPGKVSPIIIGSAGYGVYKNVTPYFTVKGGFTGSLNAGIALPAKKANKFFLTGGYAIYSFTGGTNLQSSGTNYYHKNNEKIFTINLGVKI